MSDERSRSIREAVKAAATWMADVCPEAVAYARETAAENARLRDDLIALRRYHLARQQEPDGRP